ncbi:MAG: DUF4331 family protein [Planctomycetes bacterium]|nr:DUF4331 family protein [Planctomycetota bacterium]
MRKHLATFAALAITAPLAIALMGSDHKDGSNSTADMAADIADLYAWSDGTAGTFTAVLTFAGLGGPGAAATYDPNVLYSIHIDRTTASGTLDNVADVDLYMRFARNARNEWAIQVENLPGSSAPISGRIETVLTDGAKRKVFAGLRDDPFFFDLDGFNATLAKPAANSTLSFNNTHDTFAGMNVTAIVLEMDLADITVNGTMPKLALWTTTGRIPTATALVAPIQTSTDATLAKR